MLSLFRPGDGWLHRMPAGRKIALLALVAIAVAALPSSWLACGIGLVTAIVGYATVGWGTRAGLAELARQVWGLRWLLAFTAVVQAVFAGVEPAAATTVRIAVSLAVAALLPLTTPAAAVLEALERILAPLSWMGMDAARAALLLSVALTTIPVLARLAAEVREAQRARGVRPAIHRGMLPFLVLTLRHADQLGEALAARGVR